MWEKFMDDWVPTRVPINKGALEKETAQGKAAKNSENTPGEHQLAGGIFFVPDSGTYVLNSFCSAILRRVRPAMALPPDLLYSGSLAAICAAVRPLQSVLRHPPPQL